MRSKETLLFHQCRHVQRSSTAIPFTGVDAFDGDTSPSTCIDTFGAAPPPPSPVSTHLVQPLFTSVDAAPTPPPSPVSTGSTEIHHPLSTSLDVFASSLASTRLIQPPPLQLALTCSTQAQDPPFTSINIFLPPLIIHRPINVT